MTKVYIIKNQNNLYLNRQNEWVEPLEAQTLYRTPHKDEAINTKVEHTVKNPELRMEVVHCTTNDKGIPQLSEDIDPNVTLEFPPGDTPTEEFTTTLQTDENSSETEKAPEENTLELNESKSDQIEFSQNTDSADTANSGEGESDVEESIEPEESAASADNSDRRVESQSPEDESNNNEELENKMDSLASEESAAPATGPCTSADSSTAASMEPLPNSETEADFEACDDNSVNEELPSHDGEPSTIFKHSSITVADGSSISNLESAESDLN